MKNTKAEKISWYAAIIFLLLIAALHFIKPELDPSWRFLSEYAIGDNGWLMQLAFFCLSISCFACFLSIRPQVKTRAGKTGAWLLFIVAISIIAAAIFVMDPVTAAKDELTIHGNIHGLASMVGVPGLSVASLLVSFSLTAGQPSKKSLIIFLRLAALFTLFCLGVLIVTVATGLSRTGGKFGPDVWAGWSNRLLVISWCIWLMLMAKKSENS